MEPPREFAWKTANEEGLMAFDLIRNEKRISRPQGRPMRIQIFKVPRKALAACVAGF